MWVGLDWKLQEVGGYTVQSSRWALYGTTTPVPFHEMKTALFFCGLLILDLQVLVCKTEYSEVDSRRNKAHAGATVSQHSDNDEHKSIKETEEVGKLSEENDDQNKEQKFNLDERPPPPVEQDTVESQAVTHTKKDPVVRAPPHKDEDGYPSSSKALDSKSQEPSDIPSMVAQDRSIDKEQSAVVDGSKQMRHHTTETHDSSKDSVNQQRQRVQPDLDTETQEFGKDVLKDTNEPKTDTSDRSDVHDDHHFKPTDRTSQSSAAAEKPPVPVDEPPTGQPSPHAPKDGHAMKSPPPLPTQPPLLSPPSNDRQKIATEDLETDQGKVSSEGDTFAGKEDTRDSPAVEDSKRKSEDLEEEEEEPAIDLYDEGCALIESLELEYKLRGYSLLEEAAENGNKLAKEKLSYGYMFGTVLERNFTRAFELFTELSEQGNPAGQQGLGFMYATGIGMKSNQAKAILHYVFAALGGHQYAQMEMGYRSLMGITVVQSCESALSYYHKAAKKVVSESSLITGGQVVTKVRLMDEENEAPNIYGISEDDMIHYHSVFADSGNTGAQLLLGMFYLYGMGGAERNFQTALRFLHQADMEGLPAASNLIGKIYAEGSKEVPRDYEMAMKYFNKAADMKHGDGFCGLGMMYLNGMGVEQNYAKAIENFQQAADRGSAEGQYYLGYMYLNGYGVRRDNGKALRYFQLASHGGHLQSIFNLGEMHAEGNGIKRNCNYAAELFKNVAERGRWSHLFMEAQKLYNAGDLDGALMLYTLLSELGFEVAQSNVAYLLEQEDVTIVNKNESLERALLQWNRAAAQGYAVARVKLGDYYYYGQGTKVNYEAAASQYRMASDKLANPQAMFNLGYMYELGLGLEQDYHLAKRYYDMAAETSSEAVVPVNLALLKMNFKYFYDTYHGSLDYLMLDTFVEKAQSVFGHSWDIYLISLLTGLVILLVLWRRRH